METAKTFQTEPALYAIKGYQGQQQQLQHYVQAAWAVICTALYQCSFFSPQDTAAAQRGLLQWLLQQPDAATAYSELVQRILLARGKQQAISRRWPCPAKWLMADHRFGFAATAKRYQQLQQQRVKQPLYGAAARSFAEAMLAMQETATPLNFHYWRSWFAQREQHKALNLFLSCLAWQALATDGEPCGESKG